MRRFGRWLGRGNGLVRLEEFRRIRVVDELRHARSGWGWGWQSVGNASWKYFTGALSGRHLGWLSHYGSVSFPCHPRSGAWPPSDRAIRVALWSCIPR